MELFVSSASPYARRVVMLADRLGIAGQLQLHVVMPFESPAELLECNPLSKVPALRLESGECLAGSLLISQFLLERCPSSELLPVTGEHRWHILRHSALAEGVMDASVSYVMETRRPAGLVSDAALARHAAAIRRTLDWLGAHAQPSLDHPSFYEISLCSALAYLAFRLPDLYLHVPATLQRWHAAFSELPWVAASAPRDA